MLKVMLFFVVLFLASAAIADGDFHSIEQDIEVTRWSQPELRHQLNLAGALIRNPEELDQHLLSFQEVTSPLDHLSEAAKSEFLSSLQFGPKGVASLNTRALEQELTPSQAYAVLELFGWQELSPNLRHRHSKTELDAQLNFYCDTSGFGGGDCPTPGPYVQGVCHSTGTCEEWDFSTQCHPPSCP